jgi:hypothetical protein
LGCRNARLLIAEAPNKIKWIIVILEVSAAAGSLKSGNLAKIRRNLGCCRLSCWGAWDTTEVATNRLPKNLLPYAQ